MEPPPNVELANGLIAMTDSDRRTTALAWLAEDVNHVTSIPQCDLTRQNRSKYAASITILERSKKCTGRRQSDAQPKTFPITCRIQAGHATYAVALHYRMPHFPRRVLQRTTARVYVWVVLTGIPATGRKLQLHFRLHIRTIASPGFQPRTGGKISKSKLRTVAAGPVEPGFRAAGVAGNPALVLLHGWPHCSALYDFAFHAIPELPGTMAAGRELPYFDFSIDNLAGDPGKILEAMREAFVDAVRSRRRGGEAYGLLSARSRTDRRSGVGACGRPRRRVHSAGDAEGLRGDAGRLLPTLRRYWAVMDPARPAAVAMPAFRATKTVR
ncbi:hypothetical protein [Pseudoxanthomonas sacheonensis]|uniref:hypothetical protein n=1 Tax=Pseudoxanthomonas sacheonensis TaxID=443615 RepID=UPI0013D0A6E2|nr:hypothetical protein [Pseudoxanthomonas sacheonensis]